MPRSLLLLIYSGVLLIVSLATSLADTEPIAAVQATEAQTSMALRRAEAVLSALDEEEYEKLIKKRPLVAVKTLNATEEQIKTLKEQIEATGQRFPETPLILVMICDMKKQRVESTSCYAFVNAPRGNSLIKLGTATARYLDGY